jgi:hypothetical protein
MKRVDAYRQTLQTIDDWDSYLLAESRLPGPRANLELARAVAEEGDEALFRRYLALDASRAPTNTPGEFLPVCGVLGMGRLLAQGQREVLSTLRLCASDSRWRVREAVAMALQRFGEVDMESLLHEMEVWSQGNLLEQRAAAAALCEPSLLGRADQVERVLLILDSITASIERVEDRRSDEFRALRKGLGYCWSVAVASCPQVGKARMETWFACPDRDVRWIMRQNLKKKRLERMDADWVIKWQSQLDMT